MGDDNWFERVWEYREETLYPSLFGTMSRGIFPLTTEIFTNVFKQDVIDPRWSHSGVFEFAPTGRRTSWLYVTSGMSNAWDAEQPDASGTSGLGCEFVFETTVQGDWPILRLLHLLAFQILLCHGRYPGKEPLNVDDRIPLRAPISPDGSELTFLMLAAPIGFPREAQLGSGAFDFFQVTGITEGEASFARQNGGDVLAAELQRAGFFPVTDPARKGLLFG